MESKGNVVNVSENQKGPNPQATVFVAVDTSGSMAGSKIQEVCNGLREIIAQCPSHVRFTVRKFDQDVQTVVTKTKYYLDVERLLSNLRYCGRGRGNRTALYDGIGQTFDDLPDNCSKLDVIHVLAFTDGCDNASKNYNLNSVIQLLKEKMTWGKIHFTFIQAGRETEMVNALEACALPRSKYDIFKVEDTVDGVREAFLEAQINIRKRFAVSNQVGSGFPSPNHQGHLGPKDKYQQKGTQNDRQQLKHGNNYTKNQSEKFPTRQGVTNSMEDLSRHCPIPSYQDRFDSKDKLYQRKGTQSFHHGQKFKHENNNPMNQSEKLVARKGLMKSTPDLSRLPSTFLNNFSLWVANIPKTASTVDVLKFFERWGDCTLNKLSDMSDCKCAIITYQSKECSDRAIKNGNLATFPGSNCKLRINYTL